MDPTSQNLHQVLPLVSDLGLQICSRLLYVLLHSWLLEMSVLVNKSAEAVVAVLSLRHKSTLLILIVRVGHLLFHQRVNTCLEHVCLARFVHVDGECLCRLLHRLQGWERVPVVWRCAKSVHHDFVAVISDRFEILFILGSWGVHRHLVNLSQPLYILLVRVV